MRVDKTMTTTKKGRYNFDYVFLRLISIFFIERSNELLLDWINHIPYYMPRVERFLKFIFHISDRRLTHCNEFASTYASNFVLPSQLFPNDRSHLICKPFKTSVKTAMKKILHHRNYMHTELEYIVRALQNWCEHILIFGMGHGRMAYIVFTIPCKHIAFYEMEWW